MNRENTMTIFYFITSFILSLAAVATAYLAGLRRRERPLVVSGGETLLCEETSSVVPRRPGVKVFIEEHDDHLAIGVGIASRDDEFWPNCDLNTYPMFEAFTDGGRWRGQSS